MSEVRIAAEPRTEFGKGAARRVRRAGKVPAVLYGHGTQPRHVSLPGHDLMLALKHSGANALLELEFSEGGSELALAKSVTRDPIKGFLEHLDLLIVKRGERVQVDIPVLTTGEVSRDGILDLALTAVPVTAEATHIPESIEISVEGMAVGAAVHARDLPLPSGVELATDPDTVVVHVLAAPTTAQVEADLAAAEADLGVAPTVAEETAGEAEGEAAPAEAAAGEGSEGGA